MIWSGTFEYGAGGQGIFETIGGPPGAFRLQSCNRRYRKEVAMYRDTGKQGVLSVFCCTVVVCMVVSLIAVMPRVAYARSGEKVAAQEMININTATKDELLLLKRVGPSLAGRIIAYREEHGPFQTTEDILNVKGLGEKFWEANKDRITVGEFRAKMD